MKTSKSTKPVKFILTSSVYKRYLKRDGKVECNHCGKPLKPGNEVVSSKKWSGKRVFRHVSCTRRLNIVF